MNKPNIYITRKIPEHLIKPFKEDFNFRMWDEETIPIPKDVLYEEAKQADGLLCLLTEKIDKEFLDHASHLKIIANMAVGYDNIDVAYAKEKQVIVTNTPDVLTETTADLTFALLMATARRIVEAADCIRENKWGDWSPFMLAGSDIHHKKIGIVGMGRIGKAVAKRAKGFNMNVLYHNRSRKYKIESELGIVFQSFEELLTESDFVVSLLPLSDETTNKFNRSAFQKMKSTGIFINVSRGGVVDEAALYEALVNNEIKAAGLDVFQNEPINSTHPLVSLKNVVALPHIGSASVSTRENMITLCLENIDYVFAGKGPKTPVT